MDVLSSAIGFIARCSTASGCRRTCQTPKCVANVPPQGGRKHPHQDFLQINTANILFICGGAFEGLENHIEKRLTRLRDELAAYIADLKRINVIRANTDPVRLADRITGTVFACVGGALWLFIDPGHRDTTAAG